MHIKQDIERIRICRRCKWFSCESYGCYCWIEDPDRNRGFKHPEELKFMKEVPRDCPYRLEHEVLQDE